MPRAQRAGRRRQPVRGRARRLATIAFAAAFAATSGRPAEVTNFLDLQDDLLVAGPEIRDGRAAVPARPGLGVEIDEERLPSATGWTAMLFLAEMDVRLPPDMPAEQAEALKARERDYSQAAQRDGRWPHLWRVAGRYANVSVLDVGSVDELHELLSGLPLFAYLDIRVTPLARHPNAIDRGESDV